VWRILCTATGEIGRRSHVARELVEEERRHGCDNATILPRNTTVENVKEREELNSTVTLKDANGIQSTGTGAHGVIGVDVNTNAATSSVTELATILHLSTEVNTAKVTLWRRRNASLDVVLKIRRLFQSTATGVPGVDSPGAPGLVVVEGKKGTVSATTLKHEMEVKSVQEMQWMSNPVQPTDVLPTGRYMLPLSALQQTDNGVSGQHGEGVHEVVTVVDVYEHGSVTVLHHTVVGTVSVHQIKRRYVIKCDARLRVTNTLQVVDTTNQHKEQQDRPAPHQITASVVSTATGDVGEFTERVQRHVRVAHNHEGEHVTTLNL